MPPTNAVSAAVEGCRNHAPALRSRPRHAWAWLENLAALRPFSPAGTPRNPHVVLPAADSPISPPPAQSSTAPVYPYSSSLTSPLSPSTALSSPQSSSTASSSAAASQNVSPALSPRATADLAKTSLTYRCSLYWTCKFAPVFGHYSIIRPVCGIDDFSFLYLARHEPSGLMVGMKHTDLRISPDIDLIEEVVTVVQNARLHRHPNIAPCFSAFLSSENLYSITLPIHTGTLASLLSLDCFLLGFSEKTIATLMKPVLKALDYLHTQGMLHNDIRSENLLLDNSGNVFLGGLHQVTPIYAAREKLHDFFSLPEWTAPELLINSATCDVRADIYSLGITCMELYYGKSPYCDWAPLKVYRKTVTEAQVYYWW